MEYSSEGTYLLLLFQGIRESGLLDDADRLKDVYLQLAQQLSLQIVGEPSFVRLEPRGVSGYLSLAQSHATIHTWSEEGRADIDIYTCGPVDPRIGKDYLRERLRPHSINGVALKVDSNGIRVIADINETYE